VTIAKGRLARTAAAPLTTLLLLLGAPAGPAGAQQGRLEGRPREAVEMCRERAERVVRDRGRGRAVAVDEITDVDEDGDRVAVRGYLRVEDRDGDRRGTAWLDCEVDFGGENRVARFDEDLLLRNLDRARERDRERERGRRRGGELLADARDACREMVEEQGYELADAREAGRAGAGTRLELRLRRNDRRWDAVCAYDRDRDEARFVGLEPERRGGGGSGDGRVADRDVERARDACREVAHDRGWRVEAINLRDTDEERGRVVLAVRGERRGDDRARTCVYDVRDRRAEFRDRDDDRYERGRIGDWDVEQAHDACRDIAHNRDWVVRDTHLVRKDEGRRRVVVEVEGRRRGQGDRRRECRYDVRSGDAEFDDRY
jgi:hypothetical protein